jgi:hypothetical protein
MKLKELMLCLDCDEVSLIAPLCPCCASKTLVELSKWVPPLETGGGGAHDDLHARREALFAEVREMAKKLAERSRDVGLEYEPLGCGA